MTIITYHRRALGVLLSDLVNRVSHGSGETLQTMADAQVTLQQVLLLTRLRHMSPCGASALALALNLSPPAISQAIDRLVRLHLVTRVEDPADRRRKQLATTARANALLDRLTRARAHEYGAALSTLPNDLRDRLAKVVEEILRHLP
jgi:MarR family transcriptional regulator, transcriptional regulator for hemolysin